MSRKIQAELERIQWRRSLMDRGPAGIEQLLVFARLHNFREDQIGPGRVIW